MLSKRSIRIKSIAAKRAFKYRWGSGGRRRGQRAALLWALLHVEGAGLPFCELIWTVQALVPFAPSCVTYRTFPEEFRCRTSRFLEQHFLRSLERLLSFLPLCPCLCLIFGLFLLCLPLLCGVVLCPVLGLTQLSNYLTLEGSFSAGWLAGW